MANKFSEREMQLMACAFQAMKTPPDIDYARMAELAGMTNPGSASNAMRAIRKKLDAALPANGGSAASTPVKKAAGTPRKPSAKKRTVSDLLNGFDYDDDDDDGVNVGASSAKKSRAAGGTAANGRKPAKQNGHGAAPSAAAAATSSTPTIKKDPDAGSGGGDDADDDGESEDDGGEEQQSDSAAYGDEIYGEV